MSDIAWWVYVLWAVIGIVVGWWIGTVKGYPMLGAVLGIFTVIGWVIVALLPARGTRPLPATTSISHVKGERPADLPPGRLPQHPPDVADVRHRRPD